MKKFILAALLSVGLSGLAQSDGHFGLFAGANHYYLKSNFLSSRSAMGYTVGAFGTVEVTDYSKFIVEVGFTRNNIELLARQSELAEPEWIKFRGDVASLSVIYNYDVLHFLSDDIAIGLNLGPSISFNPKWVIADDSQEGMYYVDPYEFSTTDQGTEEWNNPRHLNIYAVMGLNFTYRNWGLNARYYKGMTDPYKNVAPTENGIQFSSESSYATFTITYMLGEHIGYNNKF